MIDHRSYAHKSRSCEFFFTEFKKPVKKFKPFSCTETMNKGAPYGQTCGLSNVEMKHVGELANIVLLFQKALPYFKP